MNVFKYEFRRLFKSAITWSVVCGVIISMFMLFYPSMKDSGMQELALTKLEALPEGFLEAFNLSDMVDFSKLPDYTAYVIQYIAMASGIYGAILGVSALVKEESEGTIEFLYSKPITRSKIVTAKLGASALIFYVFILLIGIVTMAISFIVKPEDVETMTMIMDVKTLYMGMAFLGYIFMALGFLISVFIKRSKQAVPIALAVFFTTYLLGIFGKMKENLNFFLYLSPFDYAVPAKIIKNGFESKYLVTGLVIMIISILGTYTVYNKKDFR